MTMLSTSLKFLIVTMVALIGSGITYQYLATKIDEQNYLPIGKMIDIGGYKLHMIDSGIGDPTVVMDAGAGCSTLDWSLVQPEIAKFTRVISYDRAGFGWSEASPLPRTSENIAKELYEMLNKANIPGPYILVGHSLGGINIRFFANMYPEKIAGMILVDSSHEDQLQLYNATQQDEMNFANYKKLLRTTLGINRLLQHSASEQTNLKKSLKNYSSNVQKIYASQKLSTKRNLANAQEFSFVQHNFMQLKKIQDSLGDKPLIVITAGKPDNQDKEWLKLQQNLATKSSQGKFVFTQQNNHMINHDQPEIIIDSVREMVQDLRIKTNQ